MSNNTAGISGNKIKNVTQSIDNHLLFVNIFLNENLVLFLSITTEKTVSPKIAYTIYIYIYKSRKIIFFNSIGVNISSFADQFYMCRVLTIINSLFSIERLKKNYT